MFAVICRRVLRRSARLIATSLVIASFVAWAGKAAAQEAREGSERGTVSANAPIYLLPDRTRQPLRTAAAGTVLEIVSTEGSWLQVRFQDPQFGVRIGYIEARLMRVAPPPNLRPLDLSIPTAEPAARVPFSQPEVVTQSGTPQQPGAIQVRPAFNQSREGFWFNGGFGVGVAGCIGCVGREVGASGGLSLGGTLSERVLLGVGTTGWYKSVDGVTVNGGTFDARVRFYPSVASGFFLTGGGGLGAIAVWNAFETARETGVGALFGLGWDIRVSPNVSLTPFYNGFAVGVTSGTYYVDQFGLGITIH